KQFAFEQTSWNSRTVEFHECSLLAPAVIVNGARNQLFPRTCVAQEQHGRIARSNRFYEFEDVLQGGTRSNDLLKVHLAANLLFQIQLFLSEFVFEFGDLAISKRVFNCDGDLSCDLS